MSPLHHLGQYLREFLGQIPLSAVRLLFLATLAALLIWVLRLPAAMTTPPGGARRWDENLKFGACIALILQILIYAFL